ncbi:MAG: hypothetical protein QUS09_05080, partial [Methanotrichaceae archaeon]|nr:hypothetical protein [Methanotrichaceae archaeon]
MVVEINTDPVGDGLTKYYSNGKQVSEAEYFRLKYGSNEEVEPQEVKVTIDGHDFRVNPQQMSWSKEYKIEEAEIVYDKDITQWMGPKLWRLNINLRTFTVDEKDFLWYLGDEDGGYPGPHKIEAAIPTGSMCCLLYTS